MLARAPLTGWRSYQRLGDRECQVHDANTPRLRTVDQRATLPQPKGYLTGADLRRRQTYSDRMSDSSVTSFLPPRDATGPVTCAVCGCRLMAATGHDDGLYRHFPSLAAGQDARGCRPHCVDALHDDSGRIALDANLEGSPVTDAAAA